MTKKRTVGVFGLLLGAVVAGGQASANFLDPDFSGTAISGREFPKPVCPAGSQPVVTPFVPEKLVGSANRAQKASVFYRETKYGGVIHLQTKDDGASWTDVVGVEVRYSGDCHP
ncbi:hypothetical protein IY145_23855 [Methylosinus sp. H3A]|uniref:hypothetical protein n=1 Tax=Methylosinus sp. H3A TaxID=2785786 RepID=UPI0018C34659|nr:hypothetical protein [Methylosinus sp. H3A]MBG0812306.1 hypothetical protein [Methylosinus sp. H3A]MBG0812385.1 hypothetical protein [Methylosinus sp. H3A]